MSVNEEVETNAAQTEEEVVGGRMVALGRSLVWWMLHVHTCDTNM